MSQPNPLHETRLTADEREALRVAYRGPWGDALVPVAPQRLVEAVERIVVARLRDTDQPCSRCEVDNA